MFGEQWPGFDAEEVPITSITNGVHAPTWTDPALTGLAERALGTDDSEHADWLSPAVADAELWQAKREMRGRLVAEARRRLAASFREQHPEAGVTIHVGNRMTVWDTLRHHEADLVLAGRPPVSVQADTLALGENRLVVIGPSSATPRTNGADAMQDPRRETWLLREPGSGTRAAADASSPSWTSSRPR